ncbi:hypothetical protein HY638_00995 [Candidatus Woesearchaeota archaeon]|nr:hypothetical protein [Candidatus Woesearchaeota archaeon]
MAVMNRDLNFTFLVLIIVTLIIFVGFTTFYQMRFYNLTEDYRTKLAQLEKVTNELQVNRNILNETSVELEVREERASDLQSKYDSLRTDKEKVENERNKLQADLRDAQNEIADRIARMLQMEQDLAAKTAEIANKESEITELKEDVNDCEADYNACTAQKALCTCP